MLYGTDLNLLICIARNYRVGGLVRTGRSRFSTSLTPKQVVKGMVSSFLPDVAGSLIPAIYLRVDFPHRATLQLARPCGWVWLTALTATRHLPQHVYRALRSQLLPADPGSDPSMRVRVKISEPARVGLDFTSVPRW